jgi:hypothetical protein
MHLAHIRACPRQHFVRVTLIRGKQRHRIAAGSALQTEKNPAAKVPECVSDSTQSKGGLGHQRIFL